MHMIARSERLPIEEMKMKRHVAMAVTAGASVVAVGSDAAATPAEVELVWCARRPPEYVTVPAN
jgi:hypothetical protein